MKKMTKITLNDAIGKALLLLRIDNVYATGVKTGDRIRSEKK